MLLNQQSAKLKKTLLDSEISFYYTFEIEAIWLIWNLAERII